MDETRRLRACVAISIAISVLFGGQAVDAGATTVHTAILYGDSLSWEIASTNASCLTGTVCHTKTVEEFMAAHPSWRFFVRAFPGIAVCDMLQSLPGDLATYKPDVVMLETEGDDFTPCMDDPTTGVPYALAPSFFAKYQADVDTFFGDVTGAGAKMIAVAPIPTTDPTLNQQEAGIGTIMATEAAKYAHAAVTAVPLHAVTKSGVFTYTKRCLLSETAAKGCHQGIITVRAPDGIHFCPTGLTFPDSCPAYSSGAFRFAHAMSDRILWAYKNL
jgi:hypothetical protein